MLLSTLTANSPSARRELAAVNRTFGLPVAARSGGHSYAGWSITTGLIADVNIRMSTAARC
jgi:hypothetical protein